MALTPVVGPMRLLVIFKPEQANGPNSCGGTYEIVGDF
jgi:hypothetical protein